MIITILIILLLFGGIGMGPWWGYHSYGYGPSGLIGLILVILLIFILLGRV